MLIRFALVAILVICAAGFAYAAWWLLKPRPKADEESSAGAARLRAIPAKLAIARAQTPELQPEPLRGPTIAADIVPQIAPEVALPEGATPAYDDQGQIIGWRRIIPLNENGAMPDIAENAEIRALLKGLRDQVHPEPTPAPRPDPDWVNPVTEHLLTLTRSVKAAGQSAQPFSPC
ncbi:MAG: hypothetical protein JWO26_3616 [Rhodospirillales bacterium]|nr:hypothetical protein [Rhodospirillales bacterium]